jgi:transcription elongation GreA/GreB family factor
MQRVFLGNSSPVDKSALVEQIIAALNAELANYARSARSAHAEATDEQSRAENKYDTRGLEASYLARGQSRQATEVAQAMEAYCALSLRSFARGEPADVGALVTLEGQEGRRRYFIGPGARGTEVACDGEEVTVITPQSPIGRAVVGLKAGETVPPLNGRGEKSRIVAIE